MSFLHMGSPESSAGKESSCNAGDPSSIPGWGRYPGEETGYPLQYSWASLMAQMVKNLPAMWETWVWSLGRKDPLKECMVTHSSILAWRIPMDRGAWQATVHGVARVKHDWATKHSTDISEWAKYVKKFVFYMNAHQRVTSAEAGINNQVDRMTHSVNISQPLLSNLCHLSMCWWTKWPRWQGWKFCMGSATRTPILQDWPAMAPLNAQPGSHRGPHWYGAPSPSDQPAVWWQGSYIRPLPSGYGFAFPACSVSAQTTFHEPTTTITGFLDSIFFWSRNSQQKKCSYGPMLTSLTYMLKPRSWTS